MTLNLFYNIINYWFCGGINHFLSKIIYHITYKIAHFCPKNKPSPNNRKTMKQQAITQRPTTQKDNQLKIN